MLEDSLTLLPSSVVIGFYSGVRRFSLIVRVVFVEGDNDLGRFELVTVLLVQVSSTSSLLLS